MAAPNRETAEIPITPGAVNIQSSKTQSSATLDELAALGDKIFREVKEANVAKDDDEGNDRLYAEFRQKYRDFAHSFPVTLRWMVQAREYDTRAFKAYLKKIKTPFWETRRLFLESQADYLAILYRVRHPRCSSKELRKYRQAMVDHLVKEDEQFAEAHKEAEAEVERTKSEVEQERRQRLFAYLTSLKKAQGQTGPDARVNRRADSGESDE
jgi:flagellar biosynthesis/type III secretory pathway chaperone